MLLLFYNWIFKWELDDILDKDFIEKSIYIIKLNIAIVDKINSSFSFKTI